MPRRIRIAAGNFTLAAELNDSPTADAVWEALPIQASASRWGDEIYFAVPVRMARATDARADVAVGELGYWPTGHAFCIFFGPTPASRGSEPRAASPVNPLGRLVGDSAPLRTVSDGAAVRLERIA